MSELTLSPQSQTQVILSITVWANKAALARNRQTDIVDKPTFLLIVSLYSLNRFSLFHHAPHTPHFFQHPSADDSQGYSDNSDNASYFLFERRIHVRRHQKTVGLFQVYYLYVLYYFYKNNVSMHTIGWRGGKYCQWPQSTFFAILTLLLNPGGPVGSWSGLGFSKANCSTHESAKNSQKITLKFYLETVRLTKA